MEAAVFVLVNGALGVASCTGAGPLTFSGAGGAAQASPDAGLPDALPDFPDAEWAPTTGIDGLPNPQPGVYADQGAAPVTGGVRGLIGFPMQNRGALETLVQSLYDPTSASFRAYLDPAAFLTSYAPSAYDVRIVALWVASTGMTVTRVATNRLLFELTGTVQQWNQAFQTTLHLFSRKNPQVGDPDIEVYGTLGGLTVPTFVAQRIAGVLTADLPAATGTLPPEAAIVDDPPAGAAAAFTPAQIAGAYGVDKLRAEGFRGQGVRLGVVTGAGFGFDDLQSFWQSLGVTRADPTVVVTMEPVATRYLESTLDVEWSGSIADGATLTVYEGPDSRDTSSLYTFNEAIGRGEIDVLTDSFSHREDAEALAVRAQYDAAALEAAALGITVSAASGDGASSDIPSTSPFVTAVGGTELTLDAQGAVTSEVAWNGSGSGSSTSFPLPVWQEAVSAAAGRKRATVDVALAASPFSPYWVRYLRTWGRYGGTSFASPTFAGLVAVVDSARLSQGKPRVGYLNPLLYQTRAVQATFRDVTSGSTPAHAAGPGWDFPTGWGAPDALGLALALP